MSIHGEHWRHVQSGWHCGRLATSWDGTIPRKMTCWREWRMEGERGADPTRATMMGEACYRQERYPFGLDCASQGRVARFDQSDHQESDTTRRHTVNPWWFSWLVTMLLSVLVCDISVHIYLSMWTCNTKYYVCYAVIMSLTLTDLAPRTSCFRYLQFPLPRFDYRCWGFQFERIGCFVIYYW